MNRRHLVSEAIAERPKRQPSRDSAWVENRAPSRWLPYLDLRELWEYRELAFFFALKDIKVRYRQTFFGFAWAILQPLLAALIFTVVFGRLVGLPTDGIPYTVFAYAGMTLWLYFSSAFSGAAQSLVDNRQVVTKVYFPRLLSPVAAVFPGLVDLCIALLILGVFLGGYGIRPEPTAFLFPLWILATLLVALAAGLWLAALNVKYRDVRHALPFLLQLWMFASPVVYSSSMIEGGWRYVYALNPLASIIDGFRWSLADGPSPGPEALVSLAVGALALLGGFVYFRRVETYVADVI